MNDEQQLQEDHGRNLLLNGSNNRIDEVLNNIQPLRDLAKNWDIDIASCLDDFLQELTEGSWTGSANGGNAMERTAMDQDVSMSTTTTNFTQAALLLQNSSGVYSRKVEYLHGLVYQALEHYSQGMSHGSTNQNPKNRKSSNNNANASSRSDPDLEDFYTFDPHQDFLLLDDVLPLDRQGSKINLPLSQQSTTTFDQQQPLRTSLSRFSLTARDNSINNNHNSSTMTQFNASIAAFPSSQASNGGGNGALRLVDSSCHVSEENGLLLWPGLGSASGVVTKPPAVVAAGENAASHQGNTSIMMAVDDDNYDDDKEGDAFLMVGDDDNDRDIDNDSIRFREPQASPLLHQHYDTPKITHPITTQPEPIHATASLHSSLLDPYDTTTITHPSIRRVKVGKTLRLPACLSELPSECVTGAGTRRFPVNTGVVVPKQGGRQPPSTYFDSLRQTCLNGLKRNFQPSVARRPPNQNDDYTDMDLDNEEVSGQRLLLPMRSIEELEYIKIRRSKRRAAQQRRDLRQRGKATTAEPRNLQAEYDAAKGYEYDDDQHGEYAFGGDFDGDDDHHDGDDAYGAMDVEDEGGIDNEFNNNNNNTGVLSVLDALPSQNPTTGNSTSPSSNSHHPTFDELCRSHIQAFAKSAQRFATETKLTQRVAAWQAKLLPLLQEEEARPNFDIYKYSDQVIAAMQQELQTTGNQKDSNCEKPNVVDFQVVTRDCQPYEVCRLFLASLSLANSGNVQFLTTDSLESLPMELLRSDIDRPMESYLAPSAAEATIQKKTKHNPRKRMLEG